MSATASKESRTLRDFVGLLADLSDAGFETLVIGGCAVGAYARLRDEHVISSDLDLYSTSETLAQLLAWAPQRGIEVVKTPQPRSAPVAVLRWNDLEVNVLTTSLGLAPPTEAAALARQFRLEEGRTVVALVADPFHLIANKRAVGRDKDRAHVEVLLRFVDEEVVEAMRSEAEPRARLAPARRLLAVMEWKHLPDRLSERLIPLARLPSDFRFLLHRVESTAHVREALTIAPRSDPRFTEELETIARARGVTTE